MAAMVSGRTYLVDGANALLASFVDATTARLVTMTGPAAGSVNVGLCIDAGVGSTECVGCTDPLWAYGTIKQGIKDGEKWFVVKPLALVASAGTILAAVVRAQNQPNTPPILMLATDLQ